MLSTISGEYRGVLRFFAFYRRFWLLFLAAAVLFSAVSGALIFNFFSENAGAVTEALNSVSAMFEGKSGVITDESGNISAVGLFRNNVLAMFLIALLGAVPFIFIPVWALILNILIICVTISAGVTLGAFDAFGAFVLMAPHGIFELPALLISAGCGMILCAYISSRIIRGNQKATVASNLIAYELLRTFVLVITPLLIAAAVFEAYLTPALFFSYLS